MDAVERLGKKLEVKGHYISKANCQAMNFSKTNQWIHFYYYAICFRAFFGRNWRLQKGISKLSDLYFMLFSFHFFIEGLFLICEYLNRKFIFIWSSILRIYVIQPWILSIHVSSFTGQFLWYWHKIWSLFHKMTLWFLTNSTFIIW